VMAKLEKPQAISRLDEIVEISDALTDIHQMGRRFKPNMQPFRVPGKPGLPPTCW
jgi:hypothetical protein